MNFKTYTAKAYGRALTLEVVNTWQLEEGDVIFNHGCLMVCGPFEDEVSKYGTTPEYDSKGARWCTAMVTGHEDGGIPLGWMGKTEDGLFRTWRIQGNTRANWSRVVANAPLEGEIAWRNGWTITELPEGFEYRWEAERNGYAEKFYSRDAAEQFAAQRP